MLSQTGFVCLTSDAAYQGESEGQPRALEDPNQRVEDIKSAVTFLASRQEVNSNRIGVLGICTSGGYAPFATQTDLRIKDMCQCRCVGAMARSGLEQNTNTPEILKVQLEGAAADRNSDVTGNNVPIVHLLRETRGRARQHARALPRFDGLLPHSPSQSPPGHQHHYFPELGHHGQL